VNLPILLLKAMIVKLLQQDTGWQLRLEGHITVASAAELKGLLLQWLADGKDLELDLEHVDEFDITAMQMIYAAAREATRKGARIVGRASSAVTTAVRDSGFDRMPGFPILG
jgi:anti-anti-sigma regulatory factor